MRGRSQKYLTAIDGVPLVQERRRSGCTPGWHRIRHGASVWKRSRFAASGRTYSRKRTSPHRAERRSVRRQWRLQNRGRSTAGHSNRFAAKRSSPNRHLHCLPAKSPREIFDNVHAWWRRDQDAAEPASSSPTRSAKHSTFWPGSMRRSDRSWFMAQWTDFCGIIRMPALNFRRPNESRPKMLERLAAGRSSSLRLRQPTHRG